MNADEGLQVGLNLVMSGSELTIDVLKSILDLTKNKIQNNSSIISEPKTKQGKQKLSDLFMKHNEKVLPVTDNLTSREMKDVKKEFSKMGVDFSITKNGKDNFSVFFAGKDAQSIKKGLDNVTQKQTRKMNNPKKKYSIEGLRSKQKEIDNNKKENPQKDIKRPKSR